MEVKTSDLFTCSTFSFVSFQFPLLQFRNNSVACRLMSALALAMDIILFLFLFIFKSLTTPCHSESRMVYVDQQSKSRPDCSFRSNLIWINKLGNIFFKHYQFKMQMKGSKYGDGFFFFLKKRKFNINQIYQDMD